MCVSQPSYGFLNLNSRLSETRYSLSPDTGDQCSQLVAATLVAIPKTRAQIHFTQWRDASAKCDGPIKSLQGDVKWQFLQVIFCKYFQSGLAKTIVKKNCNSAAIDNFSKLYMSLCTFWMNKFFSLSFVQCSVSHDVLTWYSMLKISGHIRADVASCIGQNRAGSTINDHWVFS